MRKFRIPDASFVNHSCDAEASNESKSWIEPLAKPFLGNWCRELGHGLKCVTARSLAALTYGRRKKMDRSEVENRAPTIAF
jgi:hypothetical protein